MIEPSWLVRTLEAQLPDHLGRQRWGDINRPVASVSVRWHEVLRTDEPMLVWCVATATFADGEQRDLQLFVGGRHPDRLPDFLQGKEREAVAIVTDEHGDQLIAYDALVDPELAVEILHLVDPNAPWHVPRPLVLEHANTSVVFDEEVILKVFRRVGTGPHPDAEIPRRLAARGCEHVLAPLAELRRDGVDLAVLRPFLVGANSGWQLARTSLRDVLASGVDPEEAGGDLGPEAERLGAVIGALHVALADAFGRDEADPAAWAADLTARLERLLGGARPATAEPLDGSAITRRYSEAAAVTDGGVAIHIHGNLHLDQLIKGDVGWRVLDFEGARNPRGAAGAASGSPLQDVAGVLRSIHDVAVVGLAEWDAHDAALASLAGRWEARNRTAFLDAYLDTPGAAALLPADEDERRLLLSAFELDRALDRRGRRAGTPVVDRRTVDALLGARAAS